MGGLRNRARHMRSVTVVIVSVLVVCNEIVAFDKSRAFQVFYLVESTTSVIFVCDASIYDGDNGSCSCGGRPRSFHIDLLHMPLVFVQRIVGLHFDALGPG